MKKNILIVDDHDIVRKGLISLLKIGSEYNTYEASNWLECQSILTSYDIDLLCLDYRLKDETGADICRRTKRIFSQMKVLIFTAFGENEVLSDCITSGVDGIILKSTHQNQLFNAIEAILNNQTYYDQQLIPYLVQSLKPKVSVLNEVESTIMDYVCEGLRNKEIASEMYMSEKTIRNYLSKIFIKLEVSNRTEAAIRWKK
ncbi:MAG: response regulator transcription factor [Erysipelothrix sp.]|nr:response regulator transcription factor [Erysipelothrix sp.]